MSSNGLNRYRHENDAYRELLATLDGLGQFRMRPGLSRIRALLQRLGDPQRDLRLVIVGGTNAKGTTCLTLEALLRRAGVRTGCYLSPHLHTVRERLRVEGAMLPPAVFGALGCEVLAAAATLAEQPTYFEMLTAMAYLRFAREAVEVAIMEVGLGGEYDAVNAGDAEVAILTTLGRDHTAHLGESLAEIAATKAGIVRPASRVVTGWPEEYLPWLPPHAALVRGDGPSAWASAAAEALGIAGAAQEVALPGRCERAGRLLLDGAHNPQALAYLLARAPPPEVVVFGCLSDKPLVEMVALLPSVEILACAPTVERALPVAELVAALRDAGLRCRAFDSVAGAVAAATGRRGIVTGSFYVVAEARAALGLPGSDEP